MTKTKIKQEKTPKYRKQASPNGDRAFVQLDGVRLYLGDYGTPQSQSEYHRVMAEWKKTGQRPKPAVPTPTEIKPMMVTELAAAFWGHVESYYKTPDGMPGKEQQNFKYALKPLKELYGGTPAIEFGPKAFKVVRQRMVDLGWSRKATNRQAGRVRRMFAWAVEEELLPASVYVALAKVPGLKFGRSAARETKRVKPVPDAYIEAVRPFVSRPIWGMIQFQKLTGSRAGEVVSLRPIDLDLSGEVWIYRPPFHKMAYREIERAIAIGPKAQEVLKPFLAGRVVDKPIFSPIDADRERREKLHAKRKTPESCGNTRGSNRKPKPERQPGEKYSVTSYAQAIRRACKAATIPTWRPHQLRHGKATAIEKQFGIESARIVLV